MLHLNYTYKETMYIDNKDKLSIGAKQLDNKEKETETAAAVRVDVMKFFKERRLDTVDCE